MSHRLILQHPFYRDGVGYDCLTVRRPSPVAFAKNYRMPAGAEHDAHAVRMFGLPLDVVDHLHPDDHRRLIAAMVGLVRPYAWAMSIGGIVARVFFIPQHTNRS